MDSPSNYIPIDLRHLLANKNQTLPEHLQGAALFADISGFTPLTEALAQELGPRRGAEELTVHLNRVYDALIIQLHQFGGSVVSFSGDAITCWLNGDDGRRATASALAMQTAMHNFAEVRTASGKVITLALKVAVATGSVRRFFVGDPGYCRIDTMTGAILDRLAIAEHLAESGDIILDEITAVNLGDVLTIPEWRSDDESGQRFAVVADMALDVLPTPWPELPDNALSDEVISAWLLPQVYERLQSSRGEFLAELRPAYTLFLRFTGIDYDNDPEAPGKLDTFVREVQHILSRFDGSMLQLTIGDKGSYFYVAFGAPVAHENDAVRIAYTALELETLAAGLPFLNPVQIGITTGRMRTGAYGSVSRRTYGVLGDAANLSARLMSAAKPGQILVSEGAKAAIGERFIWEQLPNMRVKGKSEPVTLFRLVGLKKHEATGLPEPHYHLPMVGRVQELDMFWRVVTAVSENRGHIIGLTGEAGMGKSRFTSEVIRLAREQGLTVLGSECESYGTTTSYQVWRGIWRGFFDLDPELSLEAQAASLTTQLNQLDPSLLPRLPLLGTVLNLTIPENDLTRSLDAKVRKSSLEDMLSRCLQARLKTQKQPLILVLEDCQWLDDLSRDLIGAIGKITANLPILMMLVYRPPDIVQEQALPVTRLAHFTEITLTEFSTDETRRLIELKLAHLLGEDAEVPPALLERVTAQAAGNPFYIEELLNYLQDLGLNMQETAVLQTIDLPTSIYALVLSRIDQLAESQQLTIKVASVIGRLFHAGMLWGVFPEQPWEEVKENLEILSRLELTPLETPEPELTYLFKHIITQQVAYGSLLYSTRAILHEQIGNFIEHNYADSLEQYINLLAFHFGHSENEAKKREYLLKAGEAAQKDYANSAAISFFEKCLPLLTGRAHVDTRLKLGKVFEVIGLWDKAGNQYDEAITVAKKLADQEAVAWCQTSLGELWRKRNEYETAVKWFASAQKTFAALGNMAGVGQVLHYAGTLAAQQGNNTVANQRYNESLAIRRELGDRENEANLLSNLGIVTRYLGNQDAARQYYEQSLSIREEIGDQWGVAISLNNLGNMAIDNGDTIYARQQLERALIIWQEIGERWSTTNTIHSLANVARDEDDFQQARQLYAESLTGWQALDDNWGLAYWLEDMGLFYLRQQKPEIGILLISAATSLRKRIGTPRPPAYQTKIDAAMASAITARAETKQAAVDVAGGTLPLDEAIALALRSG